jgi:hypothetical protein
VRLNAIAANTVQAELAANRPEGMCASGPFFRSEDMFKIVGTPQESLAHA